MYVYVISPISWFGLPDVLRSTCTRSRFLFGRRRYLWWRSVFRQVRADRSRTFLHVRLCMSSKPGSRYLETGGVGPIQTRHRRTGVTPSNTGRRRTPEVLLRVALRHCRWRRWLIDAYAFARVCDLIGQRWPKLGVPAVGAATSCQ